MSQCSCSCTARRCPGPNLISRPPIPRPSLAAMMSLAFMEPDSSDGEVFLTPKRENQAMHTVSLTASPITSSDTVALEAPSRTKSPIDDPLDAFSLTGRSSATVKRVRKPKPAPSRKARQKTCWVPCQQSGTTRTHQYRPAIGPIVGELDRSGWVSNLAANIVGWRAFLKAKTEAKRLAGLAKARNKIR